MVGALGGRGSVVGRDFDCRSSMTDFKGSVFAEASSVVETLEDKSADKSGGVGTGNSLVVTGGWVSAGMAAEVGEISTG